MFDAAFTALNDGAAAEGTAQVPVQVVAGQSVDVSLDSTSGDGDGRFCPPADGVLHLRWRNQHMQKMQYERERQQRRVRRVCSPARRLGVTGSMARVDTHER